MTITEKIQFFDRGGILAADNDDTFSKTEDGKTLDQAENIVGGRPRLW